MMIFYCRIVEIFYPHDDNTERREKVQNCSSCFLLSTELRLQRMSATQMLAYRHRLYLEASEFGMLFPH